MPKYSRHTYHSQKGITMRTEFYGKHCPVCRNSFREGDNVVVCPVCGTPHHRECYAKDNKCGVEEYHASGFVWKGYLPDEEADPEKTADKVEIDFDTEGTDNTNTTQQNINTVPYAEFKKSFEDPSLGDDGVSMKELTAFASRSLFHYVQAFSVIRGFGGGKKRKTFFNICSGFLAPMHQFYRKMDLLGMIMIVVTLLPSLLIALNESYFIANQSLYYLFNFLSIAEQILLCLFGDYLYYRHAVRKIRSIREKYKDNTNSDEYYAALELAGRPSLPRAIIGTLVFVLCSSLILIIPGAQ